MFHFLFPAKPHPEDLNHGAALLAKGIALAGLVSLLWSGYHLIQWQRSFSFKETEGYVHYGVLAYATTRVSNVSFDYRVGPKTYTSQNIVCGGRPLGAAPAPGPATVYYNPGKPEEAVLFRRPGEMVVLSFLFALASPFLARFLWNTYA